MDGQQKQELEKAQAQIKELEKTIKRIQEETNKTKKWEPKEGYYHLYRDFSIDIGMGSYTKEQAEVVAKELRKVARMWAYKMEFDADFAPDWDNPRQHKAYPYYGYDYKKWFISHSAVASSRQGLPCFSKQACKELVDKLNSSEVEF